MAPRISRMVVFGDSVTWGQGLLPGQKFSTLINNELGGGTAECVMLAHSGAVIGVGLNPNVPTVPAEVPRSYPTIEQQVQRFNQDPGSVDLVLIDGGINDVDIRFILNPLTDVQELVTLTHLYCHHHLMDLLNRVLDRCPNANVIVTGYFPILAEQSDPELVRVFLHSHFIYVPTVTEIDEALGELGASHNLILGKVATLARTFWEESTTAIQRAVTEVNHPRLSVAFAPFTTKHAALTDDPWLWGVTRLLQPEDPMRDIRRPQCDANETDLLKRFICHRASAGHPNVEGARQFAQAILKAYARL